MVDVASLLIYACRDDAAAVFCAVRHRPGLSAAVHGSSHTSEEQHSEGGCVDDLKHYCWQCEPDSSRHRQWPYSSRYPNHRQGDCQLCIIWR